MKDIHIYTCRYVYMYTHIHIHTKFDATEMKHKVANALRSANVNSTRVTRQSNLIVNLPDSKNKEKATENLENIFENQVDIGNLQKIPPT